VKEPYVLNFFSRYVPTQQPSASPRFSAAAPRPSAIQQSSAGAGSIMASAGMDSSIIRSGHQDLNTLYASNDVVTAPITVNVCNAPNNSTLQCGCENISCPFCNLMLSIQGTDPTVLQ
jgi:hypothetical protein